MTCEHNRTEQTLTPEYTHHAKETCRDCGQFIKWVPNPDKDGRGQTSQYSIEQIIDKKGYDQPRCFFCRRPREYLGKNETFTRDHIKELQDGGEDRIENIQILCTACHKLKNHTKLYFHDHLIPHYTGEQQ